MNWKSYTSDTGGINKVERMENIILYTYALEIPNPLPEKYKEAYEWEDTHLLEFTIKKSNLDRIATDLFGEDDGKIFEEWYTYDTSYQIYEKAKEEGKIISERIVEG